MVAAKGVFWGQSQGIAELRMLAARLSTAEPPDRAGQPAPPWNGRQPHVDADGAMDQSCIAGACAGEVTSREDFLLDRAAAQLSALRRDFPGLGGVSWSDDLADLLERRARARLAADDGRRTPPAPLSRLDGGVAGVPGFSLQSEARP